MRALAWLMFVVACGTSSDANGPIARIHRFTGCEVPPGAVRVHEHVGGDADSAIVHAKVVIPKPTIEAFVRSCGFDLQALQTGYDHHAMRPDESLPWWNPPDRQLGRGGLREDERTEIVIVERDTDFAVYVRAVR